MTAKPPSPVLALPLAVVTRADVSRLADESAAVDDFLYQASVREPGSTLKLPKTSRLFDELVSSNRLNLLHKTDRARLKQFLESVQQEAPLLHMSFSADPSPAFTEKLITWLRRHIHPMLLLTIGLQPGMGAGCTIRTTNKYYDFSLRQRFVEQRELLIAQLHDGQVTTAKPAHAAQREPTP
ncbi:MAG TPA: hypothetical protein VLE74_03515 [Candidatus Saccharimonadales bacterium]|nr:hypothetical protein [Candidatus Saccharimonadales bacterium]